MGFQDEAGISEKPTVKTTWALKGCTPYLLSSGSWKKLTMVGILITTPHGIRSRLFIRTIAGALNGDEAIRFLKDLKRPMRGRKLLMIWDGLPAHRAKEVAAYIKTQKSWLRVERFPGYAPELNPIEYCWSAMRAKHLSNLRAEGMQGLGHAVRKAKFAMNDSDLLKGFLKASKLY